MSLLIPLYIFFQKPSCAKPLQPSVMLQANHFFFFLAVFLQQEVITDSSSLILPENQAKFPIASGHELPSLGACHLIRTERRIWYSEYGKNT